MDPKPKNKIKPENFIKLRDSETDDLVDSQ